MDSLISSLTWLHVAAAILVYLSSLAFYRLTLHPLAKFPGPRLAAITRYYEAFYDLIYNGQYTFKIAEMHNKYGPIVRISPYELHVSDPTFFETLYRQDMHLDKYDWAVDAFASKGSTLWAVAHNVHKSRRSPLNPFFSKAKVVARQPLMLKHIEKLCNRIDTFDTSRKTFDLGAATAAFARDVANDFILGKSYNSLDHEDFDVAMLTASHGMGLMWRLTKHVRWYAPTLKAIPITWMMKVSDADMRLYFRHLQETLQETKRLVTSAASSTVDDGSPRTIVHEIMDSKLPPSEKSPLRVFDDVATVAGAGNETTASALRLIFFHVFSNPEILQRLRAELTSAGSVASRMLDVKALEQLPYLTAILMEGLRLSPAIGTRMARIAPGDGLRYGGWHIPAGTPVGMTIYLMHTDEMLYPEPRRFDPERWMQPDARKKFDKTFVPFGRGTRNCLGQQLAWVEMYIAVAALAQRFDFKFPDAKAEDFECDSDQFAIGTSGGGVLKATVTRYQA